MKLKGITILAFVTAATLSVLPMKQAFCQDSAAGREMHSSGQDLKSAAASTGEAAEHAVRSDERCDAHDQGQINPAKQRADAQVRYSR